MKINVLLVCTICIFVQTILCSDMEKIEEMDSERSVLISERKFETLVNTLQKLQENMNYQNSRIAFLERQIKNQNHKIAVFQTIYSAKKNPKGHIVEAEQHNTILDRHKDKQSSPKDYVNETEVTDTQTKVNNGMQKVNFQNLQSKGIHKREIRAAENVAFSAYLSHTESHLTSRHIIKCDRILLNDGNGYINFTGVFTAPMTGVYMLTFFFDTYSRTNLKIVIDGRNIVDAVADPETTGQEIMGGNTVILRVTVGQSVWLEEYEESDGQTVGGDIYRFTTFSGFLLY